ncbi:MAG: hypothetical protein KKI03_13950, partial [Gammaproteobacteria bacterium]|nr:hypothetical protein [Gammaproteobacteria bacterium]
LDIPPETFFRNQQEKYGMPKVAADCRFLVPARYGDLLEMHTSVKEIKEKSNRTASPARHRPSRWVPGQKVWTCAPRQIGQR